MDSADQLFPSMPVSDPPPHTHNSSLLCLHVTYYFVPSWNTNCPPHPHTFHFCGFMENNTHMRDEWREVGNFGECDDRKGLRWRQFGEYSGAP